jgi:hypothetical protein
MARQLVRLVVAVVLVALGWVGGQAQTRPSPDFEISVLTKDGATTIECVRGCGLQWTEWVVPNRTEAQKVVSFGPCANSPKGCPSGRIGGWIVKSTPDR